MNPLSSSIDSESAAPAAAGAAPSRPKAAAKKTAKPSADSAKAAKPVAKKSATKKPAAEKPAAKKSAAKKSAQGKPAKKPTAQRAGSRSAKPKVDLATLPVSPTPAPAPKQKTKLVRDSFTMPQPDFALIDVLKARALNMKHPVKKSELLRAGLQALNALDDLRLLVVLEALEPLKAGRPKKD